MNPRNRQSSCPFPSKSHSLRGEDRGYALLIIMMLATILLISLTAVLPSAYMAGQREREEELIFRGNQYARAIALFRRQFHRYPASVKELLQTNGIRFLRREYRDPMSPNGKWRFIHADANGMLLDSRTQPLPSSAPGQKQQTPSTVPETPLRAPSASSGETKEIQGAFIAGVASSSRRDSIRVWNGRTHYDEWEFIGLEFSGTGLPQASPSQMSSPGPAGRTLDMPR